MLSLSDASVLLLPWPLSHLSTIALASPPPADGVPSITRNVERSWREPWNLTLLYSHFVLVVSIAWKIVFALFAYYSFGQPNPEKAASLDAGWVLRVLARDVLITWGVGGLWDFIHLSPWSPFYSKLQAHKFKPEPAPLSRQLPHDVLWATCSAVVSTCWEVFLLHLWGRGSIVLSAFPGDEWWKDPATLALLLALPYVQIVHFWATHRLMHKWGTTTIPDIGQFLYENVHSLHHKSKDPTAFSGISMHPVESALFFTTLPLVALMRAHPIVLLHYKFYNIVQAMIGHESYGGPSTGGSFHWIHHQLINCNYGGDFVPLDWYLGTYKDDKDWLALNKKD